MHSDEINQSQISKTLTIVKSIVATRKRTGLNEMLSGGFSLNRELKHELEKHLICCNNFSNQSLILINFCHPVIAMNKKWPSAYYIIWCNLGQSYCIFRTAVYCFFAEIRRVQAGLEACKKPTLTHVIPMLQEFNSKFLLLPFGNDNANNLIHQGTLESEYLRLL